MFSGPAQEDKSGIYRLLCRAYAVGICKDDLVGGERSPVWLQKIAALISTSETRTCSTQEQRKQTRPRRKRAWSTRSMTVMRMPRIGLQFCTTNCLVSGHLKNSC